MPQIEINQRFIPYLTSIIAQNGVQNFNDVSLEHLITIMNIENIQYKIVDGEKNQLKKVKIVNDGSIYSGKIVKSSQECSVCLEKFVKNDDIIRTECHHMFHKSCLETNLIFSNSCPLCRKGIKIHYE